MATPMNAGALNDAVVVLGCAGIVIPAFARFRITPVVGFILAGMLVGPFGLGALAAQYPGLRWITIDDPEAIAPVGEFGVILLLFAIGLELSARRLWTMRRMVFGVGAAELLCSGGLIAVALMALGTSFQAAFGLGLALALSSTALVLQLTGTRSPVGRLALSMLLFEDLAIVPIIFILGVLAAGSFEGFGGTLPAALAGVAGLAAMLAAGHFALPPLFAQAARTKSPELFLAATLLVVILASLAASAAGLSAILGALLAGLLIAETEYRDEVESITQPFRGLALGAFLITVGMSLNLPAILKDWPLFVAAIVGVVLIKSMVTTFLLRASGIARGMAAETAVLMGSPSETTLIVLGAALQAGLISRDTASFWSTVTAIGLTLTPLLARIGHDVARRMEWRAGLAATAQSAKPEGRTILFGFGRVGQMVGDMLDAHGQPWLAVESNVDRVTQALRLDRPVMLGDVARPAMLGRLDLEHARAVVLTMDDPVQNIRLSARLRKLHPELTIIARARDPDHAADLYRAGASDAVPETLESSLQLSESVLLDLGVAAGPVIASVHQKREDLRKAIQEGANLEDLPRLASLSVKPPAPP